MPDGSDPGRVERYTDRQVERVRQSVHEPNQPLGHPADYTQGKAGQHPQPEPNQRTKPSWSKATVRNNARDLRILVGQLQGLEEVTYEGTISFASTDTNQRRAGTRLRTTRVPAVG